MFLRQEIKGFSFCRAGKDTFFDQAILSQVSSKREMYCFDRVHAGVPSFVVPNSHGYHKGRKENFEYRFATFVSDFLTFSQVQLYDPS